MLTKLCGFTDEESVKIAIAEKCDFLGFVFYDKSPRFISPENAAIISTKIPPSIARVAVVVNPDQSLLQKISEKFLPDFFQFHGDETVEFLKKVREKFPKIKIIKAFRIASEKDLELVKNFESAADLFLFDAKISNEFGGSGKKFDWKILQDFNSKKDWFLSGGLNIENIAEALKITGAKMIDISSGIEKIRGKKSPELIEEFMRKIELTQSLPFASNFYGSKNF
jgi:phosphoribosylanthranilate isomerase